MADNPRYQRQNIQLENTQPFDFANIKETIKLSKSTEAGLNRISEFAFKAQSEKAKKAGLEYGVANPPSLAQISEAQAQGKDIRDIFSEDYTVFGEAARAAQASALRTDLEGQARDEFSRMMAGINTTNISELDMTNIRSNLDAIINGHSKVLAQVGAEESLKYRQSVTVLGHAVYKSALDRVEKLVQAENIVKVDEQLKTFESNIPVLLDTYKTFEEFNLALSLDEKTIREMMLNIDPTKIPEYAKQIDKIKKNAIMDRIGDYALTDKTFAGTAGEAAIKISEGQAGDYTQYLVQYVPKEEWMEVVKRKTEKSVKQYALVEATEKLNNKLKENVYRDLQSQYYNGKIGPEQYIQQTKANGINISPKEYEEIISGEQKTPAKERMYSNMLDKVETDILSIADIEAAAGRTITFADAQKLKERYYRRTGDDKEGNKIIIGKLDEVSLDSLMLKPEKVAQAAKANRDLKKKADDARAKGLPFNVSEEAEKSINAVLKASATEIYTDAQVKLKAITSKYNIPYSEDKYKAKDVDKLYKKTIEDEKERKKMREALFAIENYKKSQKNNAGVN
jgi:post-segregation antitoxin (ccd killing protein)